MMKFCLPTTGKDIPEALGYYRNMIKEITLLG
jgi:hypothetical protein